MGSHPVNLAVRLLLELGSLGVLAWWGSELGDGWVGAVLAAGLVVLAAGLWGTFNVPGDPSRSGKAPVAVPGWVRLLVEGAVFGAATVGWWAVGAPVVGAVFAAAVVLHYVTSYDRLRWLLVGDGR